MTTLELTNPSPPYTFKSLGVQNKDPGAFGVSSDFPNGNIYELTEGKFPLSNYKDMFSESGLYHTLNEDIKVKITGFDNSCQEGKINKFGSCKITVEKETLGGRKKRGLKNKSNRRKSTRRKSNRRKSNRRKSNRRR